jgi:hypothetical protein
VWRVTYSSGRTTVSAIDKNQFEAHMEESPDYLDGSACVKAISIAEAEDLARDPNLWEPIPAHVIEQAQEQHRQAKLAAKAHYPAAW